MKLVRMAVSHPHHNYNHPDISDSSAAILYQREEDRITTGHLLARRRILCTSEPVSTMVSCTSRRAANHRSPRSGGPTPYKNKEGGTSLSNPMRSRSKRRVTFLVGAAIA
jgi:hypothetical protein